MTYANLKGMPICIKHKKIYLADATMQERIWLGGGGGGLLDPFLSVNTILHHDYAHNTTPNS